MALPMSTTYIHSGFHTCRVFPIPYNSDMHILKTDHVRQLKCTVQGHQTHQLQNLPLTPDAQSPQPAQITLHPTVSEHQLRGIEVKGLYLAADMQIVSLSASPTCTSPTCSPPTVSSQGPP